MSVCKLNQLQIHTECRKGKCGICWMPKKYCPLFICAISKCHAFTYIFCPKIDLVAVDKVLKWNLFSVKSFESPTIFWLWRCSKCIWINFVNKFCWKLNGGPENFLRNFLHNSNNINLPGGKAFGVFPNYINQVSNHDNTVIAQNICKDVISLRHILVCCFSRTYLKCVVNESHDTPDNYMFGLVWKLFHNLVESGASTSIQCGRSEGSSSAFTPNLTPDSSAHQNEVGLYKIRWKLQGCER